MKIYESCNYKELSRKAANIISAQIILKPNCILGLATGSTPIGTYEQLIEWYKKGDLDFSQVTSINLDEYKGLSKDNPQSYYHFMNTHFFKHINIPPEHIHLPNGMALDKDAECKRYMQLIQNSGGIDLQLLGLGHNGHIGFNEPSDDFKKDTHCVTLSQSTIDANKRFFNRVEDVPLEAYTVGIRTIMQAHKILVIVSGEDKADIVKKAFLGPVTPLVPASILQMHPDVTLVGDSAALSKLTHKEVLS